MKKNYQKPASEIIRIEYESVMALSNMIEGGGAMPTTALNQKAGTSSRQDLEDMINDIFTID